MHLHDLLGWPGPMTHRQYVAWRAWLELEWDRPSRSDHYLMSLSATVARGNAKNPRAVKDEHFRLRFQRRRAAGGAGPPQTVSENKAAWLAALKKVKGAVYVPPRQG